jgi:glycosyltransferase involved in cell wall biosynthesis
MHNPKKLLCLSDAQEDVLQFSRGHEVAFFQIQQMSPLEHSADLFWNQFQRLQSTVDLHSIGLVFAEYIEALPLVYLMRKAGFHCPAIFVPHTNPYPLDILSLFLLQVAQPQAGDLVLCGSANAARAYRGVTGLDARSVCTFGIMDAHLESWDRTAAREALNLPPEAPLLLYTGRLMDDKGLRELIEVVDRVRGVVPEARLVISTTHITPNYYNQLAAGLGEAILFYRLDRPKLVQLYHAVNLFLCCATSVFETYGKSPLEAIAAGVPVVLPRWDGFPHYVGPNDGLLAEVTHLETPVETPFQFARVDTEDCADKCLEVLRNPAAFRPRLPEWGRYPVSISTIQRLVDERMCPGDYREATQAPKVSEGARQVLEAFGLELASLSLDGLQASGLLARRDLGSTELRRKVHLEVFP